MSEFRPIIYEHIKKSIILEYVKLVYFYFLLAQLNLREYHEQDAMVQKPKHCLKFYRTRPNETYSNFQLKEVLYSKG
jgi:hypothetical protein